MTDRLIVSHRVRSHRARSQSASEREQRCTITAMVLALRGSCGLVCAVWRRRSGCVAGLMSAVDLLCLMLRPVLRGCRRVSMTVQPCWSLGNPLCHACICPEPCQAVESVTGSGWCLLGNG